MGRFWSLLFLGVPILGVLVFLLAPVYGLWLPEDISTRGALVDQLFYQILVMTGITFVITEVVLFWFMWKYDGARYTGEVKFTHGHHNLEVIWTIITAAILLYVSISQIPVWSAQTLEIPEPDIEIEVTARQFEWRLRYPGPDNILYTEDDIHHLNNIHIPANKEVLVHLKSMDVLHSFFLPNLRVKQDAVPGMDIPVWFQANKTGEYDLVCAELCGWGHYKMKGRLTVLESEEYASWIQEMERNQKAEQ